MANTVSAAPFNRDHGHGKAMGLIRAIRRFSNFAIQ